MCFIPRRGHRIFPRACIRNAGEEGEPSLNSEDDAGVARLSLLVFVISLIDTLHGTTTDTPDVGVDAFSIFTSWCGMLTLGWIFAVRRSLRSGAHSFIDQTVRDRESFYSVVPHSCQSLNPPREVMRAIPKLQSRQEVKITRVTSVAGCDGLSSFISSLTAGQGYALGRVNCTH